MVVSSQCWNSAHGSLEGLSLHAYAGNNMDYVLKLRSSASQLLPVEEGWIVTNFIC